MLDIVFNPYENTCVISYNTQGTEQMYCSSAINPWFNSDKRKRFLIQCFIRLHFGFYLDRYRKM